MVAAIRTDAIEWGYGPADGERPTITGFDGYDRARDAFETFARKAIAEGKGEQRARFYSHGEHVLTMTVRQTVEVIETYPL